MGQVESLNYKFIKVEVEVRTEITNRETIRTGTDQITGQVVVIEDNTDKTEIGLDMKQNYRRGNFIGNVRSYGREYSRGEYRNNIRNDSYDRSRNRSRERSFSRNYGNNTRNSNRPSIGQFLTGEQANFVYKKTELGEMINTKTLQQELEHERQLNRIDDRNVETNPYKELIVNNVEKTEPLLA